ncbi:alpha/beta hydrolase [Microbacterium sp. STN6]|uniref:alpha/beta fold hydrolase n=1 Tax=Microbacterium sp. STN6 TaxID=2995588 RepID=UPI002260825B|nr:alpha/beta hydrolase [Microbacterium sp. STN6]MCX7521387.1 alpha/beta hydrolase [Microbacterium sp. STN6]
MTMTEPESRMLRSDSPAGSIDFALSEYGAGRTVLLLHGGAGPQSVAPFAPLLAASGFRVVVPTHPGFAGTSRPEGLDSIRTLAVAYLGLLDALDAHDVLLVGNSIGGWLAAEIASHNSPRVTGLVVVDAVGLVNAEHPIVDFFSLSMAEVGELSYYEPSKFRLDLDALPAAARAAMAGNRAALLAYGGTTMADATLVDRIDSIRSHTLVVWGAADRIVTPDHGRDYAELIPGARLEVIDTAGHLPQLETPGRLRDLIVQHAA